MSFQGNLLEDVQLYLTDAEFLEKSVYKKTIEKAKGKIEKREYWQTDDISWLSQKKERARLKTIILTRNTIIGAGGELSLASGCNIPGGWEPYIRKTSGI